MSVILCQAVNGSIGLRRNWLAKGVTFDRPYRRIDELDVAIAFLTDPDGTYIELTEGLDNY